MWGILFFIFAKCELLSKEKYSAECSIQNQKEQENLHKLVFDTTCLEYSYILVIEYVHTYDVIQNIYT